MHATEVDYILTERHRYDEIRNLYIDQLAFILMDDSTTEATRVGVDEKIDDFYGGDLEHATEALSALWEFVSKDETIAAPSSASTPVSQFRFCPPGVLYGGAYYFMDSGRSGHEPRPLGLCENRAHQVDSQRRPV